MANIDAEVNKFHDWLEDIRPDDFNDDGLSGDREPRNPDQPVLPPLETAVSLAAVYDIAAARWRRDQELVLGQAELALRSHVLCEV